MLHFFELLYCYAVVTFKLHVVPEGSDFKSILVYDELMVFVITCWPSTFVIFIILLAPESIFNVSTLLVGLGGLTK